MRQLWILFLFFIFSIQAQQFVDLDTKVKTYPKFNSAQQLATKISNDFFTDTEKVRAVFIWLTSNIKYNLSEFYNPTNKSIGFRYRTEKERIEKLQQIKNQIVQETFKMKTAVCEGYAQSFKKICDLLSIDAIVIKGFARNSVAEIGVQSNSTNHAWNAIKLNGKWQLMDATWASGYEINNTWEPHFSEYYFNPNPKKFLRSHLPERQFWQLTQKSISNRAFSNQPIYAQGFLKSNYILISPKNGIISSKRDTDINFQIKNLKPSDRVFFVFKGQQYGKKIIADIQNSIGTFSIPINTFSNTELYIFINQEIALEYKIH